MSNEPAPCNSTQNNGGQDQAYTTGGAADAVRRVIAELDEEAAGAEVIRRKLIH